MSPLVANIIFPKMNIVKVIQDACQYNSSHKVEVIDSSHETHPYICCSRLPLLKRFFEIQNGFKLNFITLYSSQSSCKFILIIVKQRKDSFLVVFRAFCIGRSNFYISYKRPWRIQSSSPHCPWSRIIRHIGIR